MTAVSLQVRASLGQVTLWGASDRRAKQFLSTFLIFLQYPLAHPTPTPLPRALPPPQGPTPASCAGEPDRTLRYYISSLRASAPELAQEIRGHWEIENGLHWVKDGQMNEDRSRLRFAEAAAKRSLFLSAALTVHRSQGYHSRKDALAGNANHIGDLFQFLRTQRPCLRGRTRRGPRSAQVLLRPRFA